MYGMQQKNSTESGHSTLLLWEHLPPEYHSAIQSHKTAVRRHCIIHPNGSTLSRTLATISAHNVDRNELCRTVHAHTPIHINRRKQNVFLAILNYKFKLWTLNHLICSFRNTYPKHSEESLFCRRDSSLRSE